MSYELSIIYRMTSIPSSNPSPIYQEDKDKLNEICLKSVVKAFEDVSNKQFIFLLDYCEKSTLEMIEKVVHSDYETHESQAGIGQTMLDSYSIASEINGAVLFQECDYFYLPAPIGQFYLEGLRQLDFVSPYDHPNFYTNRDFHAETCKIRVIGNWHYRTTERNTMTWATWGHLVKKNREILDRWGHLDGEVWKELKEQGHELWTPIPSFATHMVQDFLAPCVNWEDLWSIQ